MGWQRGLAGILLGVVGFGTSVVAGQEAKQVTPTEEHRPGPLPDRIILTWKGDPTRSQAVTWRTDTSVNRRQPRSPWRMPGPDRRNRPRR